MKEAQEILADWKKVDDALDSLDELGCKIKAEMDGLVPPITQWNETCKGQVDQATYDWCMAERARLEPLIAHRDASLKDFDAKLKDYNATLVVPTSRKSDEWAASCLKWIETVKDFNQRLEQALAAAGSGKWTCSARCNVQQVDTSATCPERTTGTGSGPSEEFACREAKRFATQATPTGCYPRHCQCPKCWKN